MIMFSSEDPWSIILTLIFACASAEKILPAVPRVDFIPRPTTAISAKSPSNSMLSGFARRWIAEITDCSFPSNSGWCTKIVIVSIPDGICSNEIPFSSNADKTFLPKPTSEFIISLSILTETKPFFPAIPVIVYFDWWQVLSTIQVPASSGAFVLRMLIGMPAFRTGNTASSCNTLAPM